MEGCNVIYPRSLREGDRIAIVSPASRIDPALVEGAVPVLRKMGWEPYVAASALGESGTYSGSADARLADIAEAVLDPSVRAILCSRGGYGAVHLLERFPVEEFVADPKWIIGFSDISALHALASKLGVASVHSSMCKNLAVNKGCDASALSLFDILRGGDVCYEAAPHPYNHRGIAEGTLVGGNMAVLGGLVGTPYDIFNCLDPVIFIEDIAEPIYKVERLLYQLKLNGTLGRARGLIVGQFTEYRPDRNYSCMYDMIRDMVSGLDIPVAFDFPIGHVDGNLPVVESAPCRLAVGSDVVTFSQTR